MLKRVDFILTSLASFDSTEEKRGIMEGKAARNKGRIRGLSF